MTRRGACPDLFAPMAAADGLLARVKPPAGPDSAATSSITGIPRACATARAGLSIPCPMTRAFALRSLR